MVILILCRDSIRSSDHSSIRRFLREKISKRIELLHLNCDGFDRSGRLKDARLCSVRASHEQAKL